MAKKHVRVIEIQQGIDDRWYWVLARAKDRKMIFASGPLKSIKAAERQIRHEKRMGVLSKDLPVKIYTEYKMVIEMRHDTVP